MIRLPPPLLADRNQDARLAKDSSTYTKESSRGFG